MRKFTRIAPTAIQIQVGALLPPPRRACEIEPNAALDALPRPHYSPASSNWR
jgi:hypothetical protein